ncbi:MAG: COX15/CtaA family protein, partial [Chloroherpetonaceae bacterium]|nr:COX15/CtaA family protein [Chloroherpetonaceae bacterium]
RTLYRFALAATVATYLLIFAGGLVRVSGAGMGCPDWPKCYGMWIPPTDASQLKPPYDPAAFNATLTWIEYINRLMGVLVGLMIVATLGYAVWRFWRVPRFVVPALVATGLVAVQGWLGKIVVKTDLNPFVVTLHLSLALVIVCTLIYLTVQTYSAMQKEQSESQRTETLSAAGLWLFAMLQLMLGTQVREKLEWLSRNFPLFTEAEWLEQVGWIGKVHGATGLLLTLLTWWVGYKLLSENKTFTSLAQRCLLTMMALSLAEVVVGLSLVWIGIPAVMQVFHQWIASLYVGAAFTLTTWFYLTEGKAIELSVQRKEAVA